MADGKSYRPWHPRQSLLLPPSPLEWLGEGHLAYFILDMVEELDLSGIERAIQAKDPRGTRPYSPAMMTSLLLYGYCVGVFSSRRIERACEEDIAFRVLCGGERPHFTTINAFRGEHLDALAGLFVQVLSLCRAAGLVKLGQVAVDGTKVQANASKHKAMSYERMQSDEQRLRAEVERLFESAEQADREDDARYGEGQREEDLPEELRRREQRLEKIREAKAALEQEARASRAATLRDQAERAREQAAEAETAKDREQAERRAEARERRAESLERDGTGRDFKTPEGLPMHRVRARPDGSPHPKAQYNFTDPDSRIMESGGSFLQGYNCQIAVDDGDQIIVAQAVTNQAPDSGNLVPLLEQARRHLGASPQVTTADAGYWTPSAPEACSKLGCEALIALQRKDHAPAAPCAPPQAPEATPRQRMAQRLVSSVGRQFYARRKATVEPVHGQIKEARGFRRFHLRGLLAVRGEWALICATHNLLKLFRASSLVPEMA